MSWAPIKSAPDERIVEVRTRKGRKLLAENVFGDVENEDGPCWSWRAAVEGKHPRCWTDGYCWAVNEYGVESDQPVAWREPVSGRPLGAVAADGSDTSGMHNLPSKGLK